MSNKGLIAVIVLLLCVISVGSGMFIGVQVFSGDKTEESDTHSLNKNDKEEVSTAAVSKVSTSTPYNTETTQPPLTAPTDEEIPPITAPADTTAPAVGSPVGGYLYTKGSFDGTAYINEWANLKLILPADYENAYEGDYDDLEESTGLECGGFFLNERTNMSVVVAFGDASGVGMAAEDYLGELMVKILGSDHDGVANEYIVSEYIAGNLYAFTQVRFDEEYENTFSFYTKTIDSKVVYIVVTGGSSEGNRALIEKFTTAR